MQPRRVILHCSDSSDDNKSKICAKDIEGWHVQQRGFKRIGYHDVIKRDGTREAGRPPTVQGAHAFGENQDSIGVCYVGRNSPSANQIRTLLEIYQDYRVKFSIPWTQWYGHYEFNKVKSCPGLPMDALRLFLALFDEGDFDLGHSDDQVRTFLQMLAARSH